jgi:protein associated with RNAse G/E
MPCQFDGSVLRWVDLDIDIVCYADGSIVVKDEREFEEHTTLLAYPDQVVERALAARDELLCLAQASEFPFKRESRRGLNVRSRECYPYVGGPRVECDQ